VLAFVRFACQQPQRFSVVLVSLVLTSPVFVAGYGNYDGLIADLRVYSFVRTPGQVRVRVRVCVLPSAALRHSRTRCSVFPVVSLHMAANRALVQILGDYQGRLTGSETGLIGYW
jgi:hypothetical protein